MNIQELASKFGSLLLLITWPAMVCVFITLLLTVGAICYWLAAFIIVEAASFIEFVVDSAR